MIGPKGGDEADNLSQWVLQSDAELELLELLSVRAVNIPYCTATAAVYDLWNIENKEASVLEDS